MRVNARAEYSRTFMRLACAYLEGRDVGPVLPNALADLTSFEDPPAESTRSDDSAASPPVSTSPFHGAHLSWHAAIHNISSTAPPCR